MATKRRHHFVNTQPHKKIALWSSRKRPHDDEPYTNSKRQRTHEVPKVHKVPKVPQEQIMQELIRMNQSLQEMREHQRLCYQTMAGQSARIRQLEHQLLLIKNPVGEPYIPSWVT
tara:strand:+ start:742 stop:1086 length:345 start_codon:yes stop_codon:yes gene_type:complete